MLAKVMPEASELGATTSCQSSSLSPLPPSWNGYSPGVGAAVRHTLCHLALWPQVMSGYGALEIWLVR